MRTRLLLAGTLVSLTLAGVAGTTSAGTQSPAPPKSDLPKSDLIDVARLVDDLRTLSADAMAGRRIGTAGSEAARRLLAQRFREAGLEPIGIGYEHPFGESTAGAVRGINVVGRLAGRQAPDRHIVVSAHYDHIGARNGEVFNGANDNASGAAALSIIARHFTRHPPASSLLFVAFDGEEAGMLGSRAFVRAPPVPASALVVNLNLDMIGRDASRTLWASGARQFPVLEPYLKRVAASAPITVRLGHDDPAAAPGDDWTRLSDQAAFMQAGIPALYLGVDDRRYQHRADDEFESMMIDFYVGAVETAINLIDELDRDLDPVVRERAAAR